MYGGDGGSVRALLFSVHLEAHEGIGAGTGVTRKIRLPNYQLRASLIQKELDAVRAERAAYRERGAQCPVLMIAGALALSLALLLGLLLLVPRLRCAKSARREEVKARRFSEMKDGGGVEEPKEAARV